MGITADAEIWVNGQEEDQVDDEDEDNDSCVDDEDFVADGRGDDTDVNEDSDYIS